MAEKRITIFTNHFYPEVFKVNDIAFQWAQQGHKVRVVTGVPNYPLGKFYKGYGFFTKSRECVQNVEVIRLPLIPRGKGGGLRLAINYLSYLISLIVYFPLLCLSKTDIIFVHHTSPIFIGIPAVWLKRIKGAKLFFWNLDLWPESVTAAGNVTNKWVLGGLESLVAWIYNHCDIIFISSKRFEPSIRQKLINSIQISYLPNWAEDSFTKERSYHNEQLASLNPDTLKIMFAGNMGEAQDFQTLIEIIDAAKNWPIDWVFVGDGRKRNWFINELEQRKLMGSVHWLGRHPVESMPYFYSNADVMLVSLKNEPIFNLTLPAKIQSYMIAAKPILAMLNGEGHDLITEVGCGWVSPAGNIQAGIDTVQQLIAQSHDQLAERGQKGKRYYEVNFSKAVVLEKLTAAISGQ